MFAPLNEPQIRKRFPRSAGYPESWVVVQPMGPNVLWLTEALTQILALDRGSRVLDLGCGKAVSSVFLAREFGVQVWAADLWIRPTDNLQRIRDAGLEENVFPIHAEAHSLPFAEGFFDAAVSMDAYHYFGTDDLYLSYLSRFLKPGGQLGIVVPGIAREFEAVPAYLAEHWEPDFWSFHSPAWWRAHFERSGAVAVGSADFVPDGAALWLAWLDACEAAGYASPAEAAMLRADEGRNLGFVRVVARRTAGSID